MAVWEESDQVLYLLPMIPAQCGKAAIRDSLVEPAATGDTAGYRGDPPELDRDSRDRHSSARGKGQGATTIRSPADLRRQHLSQKRSRLASVDAAELPHPAATWISDAGGGLIMENH